MCARTYDKQQSGFHLTVERDWFWFWFYYALWLASVFTLVLVLRQSSENRSMRGRLVASLHECFILKKPIVETKFRKQKDFAKKKRQWLAKRGSRLAKNCRNPRAIFFFFFFLDLDLSPRNSRLRQHILCCFLKNYTLLRYTLFTLQRMLFL